MHEIFQFDLKWTDISVLANLEKNWNAEKHRNGMAVLRFLSVLTDSHLVLAKQL